MRVPLLVVVDSPLQLINARECRWHCGGRDAGGWLLLVAGQGRTGEQMAAMAADGDWDHITRIQTDARGAARKRAIVRQGVRLLAGVDHVEQAILGEVRSDCQLHLAQCRGPRRLWLVDDGTANISQRNDFLVDPQLRHVGKVAERMLKSLVFGMDAVRARHAAWFTAYPASRAHGDADVPVITNAYAWHRSRARSSAEDGTTWVIGSNICEKRAFPQDQYLDFVRMLHGTYGQLVYRPHRFEDATKLASIDALPGCTVAPLETCLEHAVVTGGSAPRRIVGPASSAFVSLRAILGDSVELRCHLIDPQRFPISERAFMQRTQKHLCTVVDCAEAW